jgi:phosphatidylglycerophosphate synthase
MKSQPPARIHGPHYYSNWADLYFPDIANKIFLPIVVKMPWITPNGISIFSFLLSLLGFLFILLPVPHHLIYTAILLPLGYIFDCLDGQLARTTGVSSQLGGYLDKTFDILKIFLLTLTLAVRASNTYHDTLYIYLAFTAAFLLLFRFYIKYVAMFSRVGEDANYLATSKQYGLELYARLDAKHAELAKTIPGRLKLVWLRHNAFLYVEEGEFVVLTAVFALFNRFDILLWIMAISQIILVTYRLFERGYQMQWDKESLIKPMRK